MAAIDMYQGALRTLPTCARISILIPWVKIWMVPRLTNGAVCSCSQILDWRKRLLSFSISQEAATSIFQSALTSHCPMDSQALNLRFTTLTPSATSTFRLLRVLGRYLSTMIRTKRSMPMDSAATCHAILIEKKNPIASLSMVTFASLKSPKSKAS